MKSLRIALVVCGVCLLVLLFIGSASFIVGLAAPIPVDVAKAKAVALGWNDQDLDLLGYQTSHLSFIGSTGQVEFRIKGSDPSKTIRVQLRRPMYTRTWQVTDFTEHVENSPTPE
jgi:hypothetical protein